jgi:hypothetical protein
MLTNGSDNPNEVKIIQDDIMKHEYCVFIEDKDGNETMEFGLFDNERKLQENFVEEINVAIDNEDTDMTTNKENSDEFFPTWER